MSIQNRFGCIRTVKIIFTTKSFCLSKIPSRVSCEAVGSTAGIKGSAGVAGMAPAIQTQSGSSQCLTDRAGWRHCLATQNMSVSHQPQHILSLLISNILGKVSAERITLSSHLALSLPPPKRDVQSCQDAAWLAQVRNLPCFLQTACVPEEDFVSRTVSLALTEGRCSLASLQQRARGCQSHVL